jgi:hypothetical protein
MANFLETLLANIGYLLNGTPTAAADYYVITNQKAISMLSDAYQLFIMDIINYRPDLIPVAMNKQRTVSAYAIHSSIAGKIIPIASYITSKTVTPRLVSKIDYENVLGSRSFFGPSDEYPVVCIHGGTAVEGKIPIEVKVLPITANIDYYVAPMCSTISTNLTGTNNDLVFTSKNEDIAGNSIGIRYIKADYPNPISCTVSVESGTTVVTVRLEVNLLGNVISRASDVRTCIEANPDANAVVTVTNKTGNNGTGTVDAITLITTSDMLINMPNICADPFGKLYTYKVLLAIKYADIQTIQTSIKTPTVPTISRTMEAIVDTFTLPTSIISSMRSIVDGLSTVSYSNFDTHMTNADVELAVTELTNIKNKYESLLNTLKTGVEIEINDNKQHVESDRVSINNALNKFQSEIAMYLGELQNTINRIKALTESFGLIDSIVIQLIREYNAFIGKM